MFPLASIYCSEFGRTTLAVAVCKLPIISDSLDGHLTAYGTITDSVRGKRKLAFGKPTWYHEHKPPWAAVLAALVLATIGVVFLWRSFAATPRAGSADINGDGQVNIQDLSLLLINFGKTGSGLKGDLNGDGKVTIQDLSLLLISFGKPVGGGYGLSNLTSIDSLPLLQPGITIGGQSSYDRSGGNADYGNFLTTLNGEKVMLDQTGPGVVYRIWTTGFTANTDWIKVYFDGEPTPRINMSMTDFFSGTKAPFLYPLTANDDQSSGGFSNYLPLPYAHSIRITTNMSSYYNIDYKTYPASTAITSWTGNENSTVARNIWGNLGTDPKPTTGNTTVNNTATIPAGGSQTILDATGPRSISSIKLKIPNVVTVVSITDNGRAHKGSSQFTMAVSPSNSGVTLKRRMDYTVGNQRAGVYVNGVYVGDWFDQGAGNTWRDSSFTIPGSFTVGKSSLTIKIQFVSSDNDWNEFTYWAYSTVNGSSTLSDTLDVANTASENQHGYTIVGGTWSGSRSYFYPATGDNGVDALNNLRIKITWDNQSTPSVDVPVGAFFGPGHFGAYTTQTLMAGLGSDGQMYMYLPMPFKQRAVVQLTNSGGSAINGIQYTITHKPYSGDFGQTGYLHAQYNTISPSVIGQSLVFLDTGGQGNFVGLTVSYHGHSEAGHGPDWYLEGDEQVYIDGESTPSIHGTGTEDLYDGGWYFNRGPFSRPVSSDAFVGSQGADHITAAQKFYLSDSIPFANHIRYTMEHGATNDTTNDVWAVAFYYLKP